MGTQAFTSMGAKWQPLPSRQMAGKGFVYHGYLRLGRAGTPVRCCAVDHRRPQTASACAARAARRRNREAGR